ncbi:MAG: hypothetical protein ACLRO4_00195 [Lachnospiraceae bacterium]
MDGWCSISNNISENIALPHAAGRKNSLFHDTIKGVRRHRRVDALVGNDTTEMPDQIEKLKLEHFTLINIK